MKSLRAQVIRLAHEHPEFRDHLLPLVKESTDKEAGRRLSVQDLIEELKPYVSRANPIYVQLNGGSFVSEVKPVEDPKGEAEGPVKVVLK